jgi:hypothetical protein
VKQTSLILLISALIPAVSATEPSKSERTWKRKLSTRIYKIGMSRDAAEKLLAAKTLIEFTADHGFAPLRDVYYELDPEWCAVIAYSVIAKSEDNTDAEHPTMTLACQPRLIPNRPELLDELKQRAAPKTTK